MPGVLHAPPVAAGAARTLPELRCYTPLTHSTPTKGAAMTPSHEDETNAPEITVGDEKRATPELLAYLLSLANDFRRVNQGTRLEKIPASVPGNPRQCIIANALNFNCSIFPSSEPERTLARASFREEAHAERFKALTGAERVWTPADLGFDPEAALERLRWEVPLTPELNAIALAFDDGLLPELDVDYDDDA